MTVPKLTEYDISQMFAALEKSPVTENSFDVFIKSLALIVDVHWSPFSTKLASIDVVNAVILQLPSLYIYIYVCVCVPNCC